ncbi:MAG: NUDIX hydrolase [Gammaproteobacteria bacterium]|nr:NUDIX hydrolase [Gammaproteobacteria bacterium]MDH5801537.1 NUDIX hydrolase [Gammaproteobacteria bacterium]
MPLPVTPLLTVDIIIELRDRPNHPIVLIERRNPPLGWALPGGFVDRGETLETAAIREAKEETCLDVTLVAHLANYSAPKRDSRFHTVSSVYIAHAQGTPQAADDAINLKVYTPDQIPTPLAFDHEQILRDYLLFKQTGCKPGLLPTT